jgi:hypothetical protein
MQKLSNAENIPIKTLLKLFYSVVVPVLLYGCEIWGVCLLGKISSFELFHGSSLQPPTVMLSGPKSIMRVVHWQMKWS